MDFLEIITSWLFPTTITVSAWKRTVRTTALKNLATPIQEFGRAVVRTVRWNALIDIDVLGKYGMLYFNSGETPLDMLINFLFFFLNTKIRLFF